MHESERNKEETLKKEEKMYLPRYKLNPLVINISGQ